jgi:uncharacterized OB-fold protein
MGENANPIINALNRPFWDGAAEGRLYLPHCVETDAAFWPPSPFSPFAGGLNVEWREVAPEGRVLASVTYRRAFQKAFADLLPYAIAMVALDCGPRMQVHIEQPDAAQSPQAGSRVRLMFKVLLHDGLPLLVAKPISG